MQVDVTTGEVRAKLNEDETSKTAVLKTVVLEPDTVSVKELVSVGTQTSELEIHPEPKTVSVKVEEEKEPDFSGFTSKQRYTQSDEERYLTSLAVLIRRSNETEQDEGKIKEMLLAMEEVENLVHTIAFGIKLSKGKGMVTVMDLLNHKDERVRKSAALVLGSAMQVRKCRMLKSAYCNPFGNQMNFYGLPWLISFAVHICLEQSTGPTRRTKIGRRPGTSSSTSN